MSSLATTNGQPANPIAKVDADMSVGAMAKVFADSGFFKDARQAAQAAVKILAGRELGIPPVAAMTGIYIVKEKVMVGSAVLASAVQKSGRFSYRVRQLDNTGCSIEFFEQGKSIGVSDFGVKEATAAGLMGSDTYKKFTRNMFFSRALSNGVKWYCPGVLSGPVYTPEELGVPTSPTGEPIVRDDDAPAPQPARRSRAAEILDETPPPPPAIPPADTTDAAQDAPPGAEVEHAQLEHDEPICGFKSPSDWRAACIEQMGNDGWAADKAGAWIDHQCKALKVGSYLTTTEEQRRKIWGWIVTGKAPAPK